MNHVLKGCTLEAVQRCLSLKNSVFVLSNWKIPPKKTTFCLQLQAKLCHVKSVFSRLQGCLIFPSLLLLIEPTLPPSRALPESSTLAILPVQNRSHSPQSSQKIGGRLVRMVFQVSNPWNFNVIPKMTIVYINNVVNFSKQSLLGYGFSNVLYPQASIASRFEGAISLPLLDTSVKENGHRRKADLASVAVGYFKSVWSSVLLRKKHLWDL